MASWNNTTTRPNWQGNGGANKSKYLNVSTIKADQIITQELYATTSVLTAYLEAASLSTANGSIAFLSNLVLNTGVIGLGVGPTYLTANDGILYVNGDAVAFPSTLSTIADWSYFPAQSHVNMSRSSIYNVQSISTNILSTGILLAGGVSTNNLASGNVAVNNISSGNIFFDTLNGRAGTITTVSGSNLVYSNGTFSNLNGININSTRINTSNIVASNDLRVPSISTILVSSFLVEANTLYGHSTATGFLAANSISTTTIQAENVFNVQRLLLSDLIFVPGWQSGATYPINTLVKNNSIYYISKIANLGVNPSIPIPEWGGPRNWFQYECSWVDGVRLGSYRCLIPDYYPLSPNNYTNGEWEFIGAGNSASLVWLFSEQPIGANSGEIIGNNDSLVQVGNVSTISLNASSINVADVTINSLSVRNITSSNIYNSNALQTNTLDVILDSQLNTLTTSGIVNTNNVLNVNGLLALQSDMYGETQQVPIVLPPFSITEYLRSLNDIKNVNCEAINVVGGATGNFLADFRNNSIVNIGETEVSPGVVTIYGVNAELTTALTVYGLASITGDTTINGLATINGVTDLNGDTTVLGFLDVGGTLDVAGITTITGATNIGGVLTVEGETNIAGLLTAEAGIVAVGALGFTGGDITIGGEPATSPINNYNFYNYYRNTNVEALTVNKNGDFRQDVGVAGNLNVGGIIFGTVVSGSESISTLNVSTLRAFNISSITNTTQEFFVSSIAGYSNRTIHFNNDIVVPSISTTTLNMINGTGQQLVLQSYDGREPILGFNRTINGVNFLDGAIATTEDVGFIVAGFSTISISALNDIRIGSAENVNLTAASNVNLIAENVTVSTNSFVVENVAGISSIYTNYIQSKFVDLYSQDVENPAAVVFYRNIDGERFGDGAIATNNVDGFQISAASTIRITANDDMLIRSIQGNTILFNENSNIILSAPETLIPFNLTVSTLNTEQISSFNTFANNLIGSNLIAYNIFTENINALSISTGSFTSVVRTPALSTVRISTSAIRTNTAIVDSNLTVLGIGINTINTVTVGLRVSSITSYYPDPQNQIGIDGLLNLQGNSIYNGSLSSISISTGSLFVDNYTGNSISSVRISTGNLFGGTVSSQQIFTSSIRTNRAFIDRLNPLVDSGTNTANLYPQSAGAQIGFFGSAGTNSGGFYNNINVRSTITQVLVPDIVGAFSNNIRVQGNLSTQNVFVSSINNKIYPFCSTLNTPPSTFSYAASNTQSATVPYVLYSNVAFPNAGWFSLSQKAIFTRASGTSDTHQSILYTPGAFISTPSQKDGYATLPYVNQNNNSTFTTLTTQLYISSTQLNRNIILYNGTNNNFVGNLFLDSLNVTYTPSFGIRPE